MKRLGMFDNSLLKTWSIHHQTTATGYVIVHKFADDDLLETIEDMLEDVELKHIDKDHYAHKVEDLKFKMRQLPVQTTGWLDDIVTDKVIEVNNHVFKCNIDSLVETRYAVYDTDDVLGWHSDEPLFPHSEYSIPVLGHRKLTVTLMLSDQTEYTGGEFQIVKTGEVPSRCIDTIKADKGDLIIFPSFVAHNVNKITSGTRRNMVWRYNGPQWR